MTQYVSAAGIPLRGDGSPFPADPDLWTAEERAYLEQYYFDGELDTGLEHEQIALVDVPEAHPDEVGA